MKWGSFGTVHFATLALAALMIALLYLILKNRSRAVQTAVLFVLSFAGNAATVYNLVAWGEPLDYLPLHLCALNGLLLPTAHNRSGPALSTNKRTTRPWPGRFYFW